MNLIEIWIATELTEGKATSFIADELLKRWEKGELSLAEKNTVGRFCFLNGFYASLTRVLRLDVKAGRPLPWYQVFEVLFLTQGDLSKEITDALLTGASRDKSLQELAGTALALGDKDHRWPKIFEAEIKDRGAEARQKRTDLFQEAQIFKSEGMHSALKEVLQKILSLFPTDVEALKLSKESEELSIDETLANIRRRHDRRLKPRNFKEEDVEWPKLRTALNKAKKKADLEVSYNLSIGLTQMALFDLALEVLRWQKTKWTDRERIFEMEILLSLERFAEALQLAQELVKEKGSDPELMCAGLYICAKAYRGLEDWEQAVSILRGLLLHRPQFRDAPLLLAEWQSP